MDREEMTSHKIKGVVCEDEYIMYWLCPSCDHGVGIEKRLSDHEPNPILNTSDMDPIPTES
jgi:hypothetical protein